MDELDLFETLFYRDIETWFTAGIACCDACYDEYIETWPNAFLRGIDFQSNATGLDLLYSAGRLKDYYSEDEYWKLVRQLKCPNCFMNFEYNIYPYDLPFDPPSDFEENLKKLKDHIESFPFLVLENDLARDTFTELEKLSTKIKPKEVNGVFYRGRTINGRVPIKEDFLAPPKSVTKDGRYNHTGIPIIYIATTPETVYYELRQPKTDLWIAKIELNYKLKILDFSDEYIENNDLIQAISWSSLASSPKEGDGLYKPQYYFTRFISDCCKYFGFDGIKYPSIRYETGFNLAIFDCNKIETINILDMKEYLT
ncbi:hypothetical protein GCM10028808_70810 [Spirosoma migulaei]